MGYYLYHHGILGQRWGKRNGPPYPLGESDHSKSEKQAGWKKSLDSGSEKSYNDNSKTNKETDKKKWHLSDGQKRAIKIGATVAATALLAYGTYRLAKSGKLNELADIGKNKVNELLGNKSNAKEALAGNADDILKKAEKAAESVNDVKSQVNAERIKNAVSHGFKVLSHPETLAETLKNTNPLRGNADMRNNCTSCSIAAFLRRCGIDVTAKSTGGEMQNLSVAVENYFKDVKVLNGNATKFGKSRDDAAEMLLRRYGSGVENPQDINAEGVVGIKIKDTDGGHAFNWVIKNGVVSFFDAQNNLGDKDLSAIIWKRIDTNGYLTLARLDNAEINFEAIGEYVTR